MQQTKQADFATVNDKTTSLLFCLAHSSHLSLIGLKPAVRSGVLLR